MNFFEHQASARRQTGRLLFYFLCAVVLIVFAVNLAFYALLRLFGEDPGGGLLWHAWSSQAVIGTLMLIVGGSFLEYLKLRGGGSAIAEMVGARRVDFASTDENERRLINVVDEMAIASGVRPPQVYVMDRESGINAFVAGLTLDDTVMVVTRGALEAFDRDEMQAVAGHEFSHILNGDMRLNVRLMALLAGILAIGQMGGFMMRMSWDSSSSSSSRSDRRGGSIHLFVVGLMLWLIGYVGLFFGRLIKAAISRQREFLADASSVQFTRNPDGLANALLKIMYGSERSWLHNLHAEDMSHLCFGETLKFSSLLATHPPLEDRIRIIGPGYLARGRVRQRALQQRQERVADRVQEDFAPVEGASGLVTNELPAIPYVMPGGTAAMVGAVSAGGVSPELSAQAITLLSRAGTVNPAELASAIELHRRLPEAIKTALQTSTGAQSLLFALVARQNGLPSQDLSSFLRENIPRLEREVMQLHTQLDGLSIRFALPLTELALPRLQVLSVAEQKELFARLQLFARLDKRISTFEFALLMLMRKQLLPTAKARPVKLENCIEVVSLVLAIILHTGGLSGEKLERTHARLMRTVTSRVLELPAVGSSRFSQLAREVQTLAGLPINDRRLVLELAATAVLADAMVNLEEYELLRVVASLMDCPMPLLVV
ncbi:MAG: M48 family metallopeptidase [Moraxellaceae bacterium]|nr:M48 family metallopeptidase [Moraxellaceae bacterium]